MPTLRVICPDCADLVEHHCHSEVKEAVMALLSWVPEHGLGTPELMEALKESAKANGWDDGDEEHPIEEQPFFGSQSWSYPLFGSKDSARSFHALIHNLIRATGMDPSAVQQEILRQTEQENAQRKAWEESEAERKKARAARKSERGRIVAFLQGDAPTIVRIGMLDELLKDRAKTLEPTPDADTGYGHLYKWLDKWYGGGISAEINEARIQKLLQQERR